jgi:hypothetical protein
VDRQGVASALLPLVALLGLRWRRRPARRQNPQATAS